MMTSWLVIASIFFGAIVGSFLNVLILRLPRTESILGRSYCPTCKRHLTSTDLVPLFSFLFLRGKCRTCGSKISARYFIIELITGLLFGATFLLMNPHDGAALLVLFRLWVILAVLVVTFVIDLEHYLILDVVVFPASLILLFANLLMDTMHHVFLLNIHSLTGGGIIAALIPFGLLYSLWYASKGKWIGFGDVKFMLVLGLALGWPNIWVGLFIAFVLGGIVGMILLATGKKEMQSKLPLGTFLAVGAGMAVLWGSSLLSWYLGLLGVV